MTQDQWLKRKNEYGSTYNIFNQHAGPFSIRKAIVKDVVQGKAAVIGLDLLPSNPDLVDVDLSLSEFKGYNILLNHFEQIRNEYDYIICDCPPTFNPITKNALWASDAYVVPTVPDFLSTYGIGLLERSVKKLLTTTTYTPAFKGPVLGGILLTRVKHTNVSRSYCEQVQFDYPRKVFKHMIKDSTVVAGAPDDHMPISALNPARDSALELQQQFQSVAGEFISRIHHLRP
jgi:chromosome partitioning protein